MTIRFFAISAFLAVCGLFPPAERVEAKRPSVRVPAARVRAPVETGITQIATIDSLLAGVYDGETTLADLRRHGDFGIGTFQSLDGEMVLLDGAFYQIKADGKVYRPSLGTTTPFASALFFPKEGASDTAVRARADTPLDYVALCRKIDAMAPNPNVPIAVHLTGRFSGVRTRSVPGQAKPYRPLAEVTQTQPEFELGTIEGDVVGFRLPAYVRGINVPGYHLHFLGSARRRGGHLLRFGMESGRIAVVESHRLQIILPQRVAEFSEADLSKDRSVELEKVEK